MCKHAETFQSDKGHKLAIVANFVVFKKEICGTLFKRYLHQNEALTALFFI